MSCWSSLTVTWITFKAFTWSPVKLTGLFLTRIVRVRKWRKVKGLESHHFNASDLGQHRSNTWCVRGRGISVSQEGLVTPSGQKPANRLMLSVSMTLCIFILLLKCRPTSCKIDTVTSKLQSSLLTAPLPLAHFSSERAITTLGLVAWGLLQFRSDVWSPLISHRTLLPEGIRRQVAFLSIRCSFSVSNQYLLQCQTFQCRKTLCEPSETEKCRNSQARELLQDPLLLYFPTR